MSKRTKGPLRFRESRRLPQIPKLSVLAVSLVLLLGIAVIAGAKIANAAQAKEAGLPYSILVVAGQSNAAGAESLASDPANGIDVFGAQSVQPADSQVQMLFDNTWGNDSLAKINPVPLDTLQRANQNDPAIFGPEVGLARKLYELGRRRIIILKVTVGAAPLAQDPNNPLDWSSHSTNEAFQRLKDREDKLFESLDDQGAKYNVDGFYWVQGEDDSHSTDFANHYEQNLRDFVATARSELKMSPGAQFVIGQNDVSAANNLIYSSSDPTCQTQPCITAKANNDKVRAAQATVAADTPNVRIVDTAPLARTSFQIHMSNVSQLELGKQMAEVTESSTNNRLPAQDDSVVASVSEWDKVYNRNRPELFRDGGSSIRLGNNIMWMFGDTFYSTPAVDGTHGRSSTAALAPINDPHNLSEPLDANGRPYQFIPLSEEQKNWNLAHIDEPDNIWLKWPTSAINTSPTEGYVFYLHLRVLPNNGGHTVGTGLAKVVENSTTAIDVTETLFGGNEPSFTPTVSHDGILYLENCSGLGGGTFDYECATGRVPIDKIADRGAYEFWDGTKWNSDINSAKKDANNPKGAMAWSDYLQKYVQFYARSFSSSIVMRTANSPEGPWSDAEYIHSAERANYAGIFYMHPELFSEDGKTLVLSVNKSGGWGSSTPDDGIYTLKINLSDAADARLDSTPNPPRTGRLVGALAIFVATIGLIVWGAREVDSRKRITRQSSK